MADSSSGRFWLLGWRVAPEAEWEGGVPNEVADLLARSWTRIAVATFPRSSQASGSHDDVIRVVEPTGLTDWLGTLFSRDPSRFQLVSTRRAELASTAFDDPGFPWWLQRQVILLSRPNATPPALTRGTLLKLIDPNQPVDADRLVSQGIEAVVRPGVDGDVAGILASNPSFAERLANSFQQETARSGFAWQALQEEAFIRELSEERQRG